MRLSGRRLRRRADHRLEPWRLTNAASKWRGHLTTGSETSRRHWRRVVPLPHRACCMLQWRNDGIGDGACLPPADGVG